MKRAWIMLVFLLAFGLSSCRREENSHSGMAAKTETKGGIMRVVAGLAPQVLGYPPEMGPQDITFTFPGIEPLMTYTDKRTLEPFLCTKVDIDSSAPSITFFLRKGIQFHDGTELTADVARWNYQIMIETKKLQYSQKVKSIDILDPYTFRINLTDYNNLMIHSLGNIYMISKDSFHKFGKEWARANCIGTGPFRQVEFKRDSNLNWKKFDNYWRKDKGLPYLDGIEVRFTPDPVTAASIMETKQADLWIGTSALYQRKMVGIGLVRQAGFAGLSMWLMPNYLRQDGKWKNKKLREALECAIDKNALTKAFGYGFNIPMNLICPADEWGYDSSLHRDYDPAKARRLVKESGLRMPVKIKILCDNNGKNTASGIKGFLDEAGFDCEIDVGDSARYFSSIYSTGWDDLCFAASGIEANYLVTIGRWFSPESKVLPNFEKPQAIRNLWNEALAAKADLDQEAITRKIIRYVYDEALICPLYKLPTAGIMQPYVHTNYLRQGMLKWDLAGDWMEKH